MIADPRPDLSCRYADGPLWRELFRQADGFVRDTLVECREKGTYLFHDGTGWRLRPHVGPGCWPDEQEYRAWRDKHLMPHRMELNRLLAGLKLPQPPDWLQEARSSAQGAAKSEVRGGPPPAPGYTLVDSLEEIRRAVAAARVAGVCGLDTETARRPGSDRFGSRWDREAPLDPHLGRVRLLQIGVPGRPSALIDLARWWDDPDALTGVLQPVLELLADPNTVKVVQHGIFDLKMLRGTLGGRRFEVANLFDSEIAGQLLACGMWPQDGFNLAALVHRHLGWQMDKTEQGSDWSGPLTESQFQYASRDVAVLPPLYDVQREALTRHGLLKAADVEYGCIPAVADMEYAGIRLDVPAWKALREQVRAKWAEARERVLAAFGAAAVTVGGPQQMTLFGDVVDGPNGGFNPDSTGQVLSALRDMGAAISDTRDETLQTLALAGGKAGQAAAALIEYRGHAKALSAFLDPILDFVHPLTGRIHASYRQLNRNGVGRFSAFDPNIQQIPRTKEYRSKFIPGPDHVFGIADYSAIELRIMAWLSGDPVMMDAFIRGVDVHRLTASLVMGTDITQVTKAQRQAAKAVNFGLCYGQSAPGLQAYAQAAYGVAMSLEEAQTFRKRYFDSYKGVTVYHTRQNRLARAAREVRTASGRCRRWESDQMPATQLYNTPDQGTGADILKRAMARLRPHLIRLDAELVGAIHDELVTEVPEDRAQELLEVQIREMVAAGEEFIAPVPVDVEGAVGRSWADKN